VADSAVLVDSNVLLDILTDELLTRDPKRYRTYFPGVELLAPAE
jgi:hypothetical protein